jgi:hypothetical protein
MPLAVHFGTSALGELAMEHDHHVLVADRNPVNGRNTAGHHKLVAAVGGRVRQRGALPQLARREEPETADGMWPPSYS